MLDQTPNTTAPPAGRIAAHAMLGFYDRWRWVLLSTLVGFYLLAFTGQWLPEPDSALYLSIGRHLAQGEGYTYLGMSHTLAYPGMPYLIAATFEVFGAGVVWPIHLVMLVFSLVAMGLIYRLFLLHVDRPHAVLLTCMTGMSYTLFRYSVELRNDMPFLAGVMGVFVGLESWRRYGRKAPWYDTGLFVGGLFLAAVMRPHVWVLIGAMLGAMALSMLRKGRRRGLKIGLMVVMIAVGVAALTAWADRGSYEAAIGDYLSRLWSAEGWRIMGLHLWELLDSTLPEATLGHQLGPGLSPVYGLIILVLGIGLIRIRPVWGLFVLGTAAMVVIVLPTPRYLLPILPLLALGWWRAMVWMNERLGGRWGNVVFAVMLVMWVVPNALRITKVIAEQRSPAYSLVHGRGGSDQMVRVMAGVVKKQVEPGAFVLADPHFARVLGYYADRMVAATYELPNGAEIRYVILPGEDLTQALYERGMGVGEEVAMQRGMGRYQTWELRLFQVTTLRGGGQ